MEGVGVEWVRTIKRTYYLKAMVTTLRKALTTPTQGPKVLIAQSECMLSLQQRQKKKVRNAVADGQRLVRERFNSIAVLHSAFATGEYKKAEAEFHRPHGAA